MWKVNDTDDQAGSVFPQKEEVFIGLDRRSKQNHHIAMLFVCMNAILSLSSKR